MGNIYVFSTVMTVTLLVSGFIIGPGGVSIRAIQHNTGTQIMSWTQSVQGNAVRMFSVQVSTSCRNFQVFMHSKDLRARDETGTTK